MLLSVCMKSNRNVIMLFSAVMVMLGLTNYYLANKQNDIVRELHFSDFVSHIEEGKIGTVFLTGPHVRGNLATGEMFKTYAPPQDFRLVERLLDNKVKIIAKPINQNVFLSVLLEWIPTLLFIGVLLYTSRLSTRGGMKANHKKAKNLQKVTFADIGGLLEAKEELKEIVSFLKAPQKYRRLGAEIPKGVLLVGSPGNGKTFLARAIAGEAEVPFFYMSGASFVEMYVGVGAARVRELFKQASLEAPALIFIDEIDAVGTARGSGGDGGSREFEKTLNELLISMDGFAGNSNVIVIAATNRDDVLDAALMRRFERKIYVNYPDIRERISILKILTKSKNLAKTTNLETIAKRTAGTSAADLKTLVNEAALIAARNHKRSIGNADLNQAIDRIFLGVEKKHSVMTKEEKELTAYHESGHAIAAYYLEHTDPIHKVTIVPRGHALGMVAQLPEDKVHLTLAQLKDRLLVASAGRVAEVIKYGEKNATTGASSDIKYATSLAWTMITQWGFSKALGPVNYDMSNAARVWSISDETKEHIMSEVRDLLNWAQVEVTKLLKKYKEKFELLTKVLLEKETLSGEEVTELLETGMLTGMGDAGENKIALAEKAKKE